MDESDFDDYVAARWLGLVRSAYLMGCREHDAEDLVQAVLTDLYRHRRRLATVSNPDAYVYRSLLNAFRRSRRRRWLSEVPTDLREPDVARPALEGTLSLEDLDLRTALLAVEVDRRAVLVLKFLHDMTDHQVSELLEVPIGTVKSRASRGLQDLRRHYPVDDPITQEQP